MTFRCFQDRLIEHLRARVQSGELTERGLARLIGISQPHMHHVLKGKRDLSPATADRILVTLSLDLMDLLDPQDLLEWRSGS
jgi:plasmid maintenance system antidote protein VapI